MNRRSNRRSAALGCFALALSFVAIARAGAGSSPEVLPGVQDSGAALDVSAWKFRKPVKLTGAGVQQLEFDLDVLSHAQPDFGDVRLVRDGKQVAWLRDRPAPRAWLTPAVTATAESGDPKLSRWIIKLSHGALPVTRLECVARTPLFQRELTLYEDAVDPRGNRYRRVLGHATWTRTPDQRGGEFTMDVKGPLQNDTLFLETQNGDNPPLELERFQLTCPTARVLFKAGPDDKLFLYYGNRRAVLPQYDLSLVAGDLFSARKVTALPGAEEQLRKSSWLEDRRPGEGGVLFWGILALVVVVLLVIISQLLPKAQEPRGKN